MLTRREIAGFERDGYVILRGAIPRPTVGHCRRTVTARLRASGIDVDDPSTWTRPVAHVAWPATASFAAAGGAPALVEVYDQLLGPGAWEHYPAWGGVVFVRFPNRRRAADSIWHVDGTFPRDGQPVTTLESRNRGVLCLVLLSDVGDDDGPTELLVGSHLDIPPILEPYGTDGCPFATLVGQLPPSTFDRPILPVTGRAGDVYVCHPFLVHRGPERHRGTTPRLVAQPGLLRHRPFRLDGGRPRAIERAIRSAFDRPPPADPQAARTATATQAAPKKAAPKKAAPKKAIAKKAIAKKAIAKKAIAKKAIAKKAIAKKAAAKKPVATKAVATRAGREEDRSEEGRRDEAARRDRGARRRPLDDGQPGQTPAVGWRSAGWPLESARDPARSEHAVNKQIRQMLNDAEQELLRQTEPAALKKLDEDELLEVHRRVRRARNKYSKLYRRRAAAQVDRDASRGRASATNSRTAIKAEVFEDALARVSRRLAREAWLSADRLRHDRLAAARGKRSKGGGERKRSKAKKGGSGAKDKTKGKGNPKSDRTTPASKRDTAAARAATRRKQAKRDSR